MDFPKPHLSPCVDRGVELCVISADPSPCEFISSVKSQTLSFGLCGKDVPSFRIHPLSFFQCTSRDRFSSICLPCAAVLPKPDGFPFSLVEPFSTSRRSAPRSTYLHCGSGLHYLPLSRGQVALHINLICTTCLSRGDKWLCTPLPGGYDDAKRTTP